MARRRFGGDLTAVAWGVTTVGETEDLLYLAREIVGITVWDSSSAGEQVTDLLDGAAQELEDGIIAVDDLGSFVFYGPDTTPETTELWLDAGFGGRQLIVASDLGPEVVATTARVDEIESDLSDANLSTLSSTVAGHTSSISSLSSTVSGHTSTLSSLGSTVSGHTSTLSSLGSTVSGHTSSISSLGSRVTALENATLYARKPSGEDYGSTSLHDDNDLALSMAGSATYHVGGVLRVLAPSGTDLKLSFAAPSEATVSFAINGLSGMASDGADDIIYLYSTGETAVFGTTSGESRALHFHGMVRTSSSGTFRLRWARNTASGTLSVLANSFMYAHRLDIT